MSVLTIYLILGLFSFITICFCLFIAQMPCGIHEGSYEDEGIYDKGDA